MFIASYYTDAPEDSGFDFMLVSQRGEVVGYNGPRPTFPYIKPRLVGALSLGMDF